MSRKTALKLAVCQLFAGLFCLVFVIAHAGLDAPHNGDNGDMNIGCLSCHQMTSTYPKLLPPLGDTNFVDIDDTIANRVCRSCHAGPPLAIYMQNTHSSLTTSTKHGNWTVECWVCHNQHLQEQNRYNGSTYGKYIRRSINLKNIKDSSGNPLSGKVPPDQPYIKSVIFKGSTGANSFADGDTTVNGICEVCHTTSAHSRNNDTLGGDKHFQAYVCTECHDHTTGFKPGWPDHDQVVEKPAFCTACHATSVFALHQVNDTTYANCNRCHQTNNNYEFTGTLPTVYLKDRLTKHIGKNKLVFPGTAPARCDDCHHGQFTEHVTDTGHNRLHDKVVLGYDRDNDGSGDQVLACDACHFPDAIQEHVTRRNLTCSVCHDRAGLGLAEVAAITSTIAEADGMDGTPVFCDNCHDDDHFLTEPGTSLVKEHHATPYSRAGECSKCHVVGPGERGPHRPPCWYCHATGKPGDPQRAGVNRHDQGAAITADAVKDFRVCFSCHLDGGQGYVAGATPLVTPMHGLPGTAPNYSNVYWPYGYYRDASDQWVASDPLLPSIDIHDIPVNLENDPARWSIWPGWHTLNYLGEKKKVESSIYNDSTHPEVQNWARFGNGDINYSIRRMVDIAYLKQDYPTVPISNGGDFDVPSFDGTGSLGKPTGSGSVGVTLNPEAVAAGAQWRLDGGPWQESSTVLSPVSDRADHLVEFKPIAGKNEPPPLRITVANGQATVLSGADATYADCPDNPQLKLKRTGADPELTFTWDRPEQMEEFLAEAGLWHSGRIACEVWRKSGNERVPADGFAVKTSPTGDGCQLFKTGATPAGPYDLILRATGSSCFRNNAELALAVTVTPAGSASPVGQAGGRISQPFLNSLALPATAYNDFLHLTGNLYVHLNMDGVISTFTIDSGGSISPVIASTDLWAGNVTSTNTHTKMVRVSDTLIAISYKLNYSGSSNDNHIMTVGIEQNGSVIHKIQDYMFYSTSSAWFPRIYPHHDNNGLFIVTWGLNDGAYRNGLLTVHINQSGRITEMARDITMPGAWSEHGSIVHVAGDYYAFVRNKYINMFRVSNTGAITIQNNPGSQYQYSTDGYYAEMARVKGNIFAVSYIKNYVTGPGMLKTLSISDSGVISPTINSYLFEPCGAGAYESPHLLSISDNVVGVYYAEYGSCDEQAGINFKTLEITDDGRIMVPPLDTMELRGGSNSPKLLHVSGDLYAFLVIGDQSEGVTFNGVKTYGISTDRDRDGIPSDTDNCDDITNAGQADSDGDGVGDVCDVCPGSDDTLDADSDGIPDACDTCAGHDDTVDSDSDDSPDGCDPCPGDPDNDADNDGICVGSGFNAPKVGDGDNCPLTANGEQIDLDCNGIGDVCETSVIYLPPGSMTVAPLTSKWLTLSWNDTMHGEDGYRLEGKQGACSDTTTSFGPLATVYRYDRFDNGLDTTGWVVSASVKTSSSTTFPASVTDSSGIAEVSWEDGKIKLHTVMNDIGEAAQYNSANISINKFAQIIGDKDFDVQVDYELPNGAFFGDQYHVDVRLSFYFPDTDGKHNEAYIERWNGFYSAGLSVHGTYEAGSIATIDDSGTLRLVRKNRELAAYILDGDDWILIKKHSQPLTADLVPTWAGIVQYAQRNESGGGELTALVDNFKFNTVGSMPVAVLDLPLDETSWIGTSGEVKDATAGNNHGTARNGAKTDFDGTRGTVGSFDGVDDYVEIPGSGSLENVTDKSFTFAAWAKPTSVPSMSDPNPPANDWRYTIMGRPGWHTDLYYNTNKTFRFEIWNDADNTFTVVSPAYDPGQWHHVAGVADDAAKAIKIYIDGELKGTVAYTGNLRDYGTIPYLVGTSNHDVCCYMWFFHGLIDDARVFDHALSDSEVAALAQNRLEYSIRGQSPETTFCARAYPFKTNGCDNWVNHAAQAQGSTLTSLAAQATTAGKATAVSVRGAASLYVNAPYFNDTDADNSYSVEYKLSSAGTWTTLVADAPHTASPFATKISNLTVLEKYDVRVTYADPDGMNGTAQQVIAKVIIEPGQSCLSILNNGGSIGDGIYWLDPDGAGPGAAYQAYCDMTSDGGGWTLAMKLDGSQTTFQYSASYWTTTNTLNPGSLSFDTTQAKLQSFNDVAFTQVRLGMRHYTNPADDIDWITVNQSAGSLVSLFNSGFIVTGVGRANWLNLLEGVNTQDFCNKEGFNTEQSYSKMRIGLAMNGENDCNTCDRILGFGNAPTGHPWGAWAVVGGGYPGVNTQAYGWILVR